MDIDVHGWGVGSRDELIDELSCCEQQYGEAVTLSQAMIVRTVTEKPLHGQADQMAYHHYK